MLKKLRINEFLMEVEQNASCRSGDSSQFPVVVVEGRVRFRSENPDRNPHEHLSHQSSELDTEFIKLCRLYANVTYLMRAWH